MGKLEHCWNFVREILNLHEPVISESKSSDIEVLQAAGQELDNAHKLLKEVTEPDLIDYAIYRVQAAEKRYDYLYKLVKGNKAKSN